MSEIVEAGNEIEHLRRSARRRQQEKRCEPRYRTRLRTGQLYDMDNNLIAACLICDRSARGARLKLQPEVFIPGEFLFYEDEHQTMSHVQLRWRRGTEMGIYIVAALARNRRQ